MAGLLTDLFTAPYRAMEAQPPQANFGSGVLGNMLTKAHGLLDPVQAMGGYGNLAAMALPPGSPFKRGPVYHGSPDARGIIEKGFQKKVWGQMGDRAAFFTDDPRIARSYADPHRAFDYQGAEPAVVPATVEFKNPKTIDWGGKVWHGTKDVIDKAIKDGHDGVVIKNVIDPYTTLEGSGKRLKQRTSTVYVALDPERGVAIDANWLASKKPKPK
jgi:hypothetical protein